MKKRIDRSVDNKLFVTIETLSGMLECGRVTATQIGLAAGARVQIGKSVRYSVEKVKAYLDALTEA